MEATGKQRKMPGKIPIGGYHITEDIYNYYIHGLATLRIAGNNRRAMSLVDKHYSTFKVDKLENPDLEVFVQNFKPSLDESLIVDDKYYVSSDTLFCRDSHKISRWKVWIKNMEGKTRVYFSGDPIFSHLFLFKYIIEPIIFYKLANKGYSFIHSSCVSDKDYAYIFIASKGTGKTSTALKLVNDGWHFFSDEYTILSKEGTVYSYPNCIHLHQYNFIDLPFLKENLSFSDRLAVKIKGAIYKATFKYANIAHNVEVKKIFPNLVTETNRPLGAVILLIKTNRNKVRISKIDSKKLVNQILVINRFEIPHFVNYLNAFSFNDPFSNISRYEQYVSENLQCINKVPCYGVELPKGYSEENFKVINELLDKLKVAKTIQD